MRVELLTPGVYRQDITLTDGDDAPTGIPVFIGHVPGPSIIRWMDGVADLSALGVTPIDSYLGEALQGFFDNGGTRCHVATIDADTDDLEAAYAEVLDRLVGVADADLIAAPDLMRARLPSGQPDTPRILRLQRMILDHCGTTGGRFAVLDTPPDLPPSAAIMHRRQLTEGMPDPVDGAIYYPWLRERDGLVVPPCGHVAGAYAAADTMTGVFRAPAGMALAGVLDVAFPLDQEGQSPLHEAGINCLRGMAGRGIRIWGARTLCQAPEWRYVNVRRLFLTVGRWIEAHLGWAVFEPNAPTTWARIDRALDRYVTGLWRSGALFGATAREAFQVRIDTDSNDATSRDGGRLVVEIGLAPARPAEFVVVRLTLRDGTPG